MDRAIYLHYSNGIVIEHSRNIFRGELVCRVADQKASLSNSTVTDNYTSIRGSAQFLVNPADDSPRRDNSMRDCRESLKRLGILTLSLRQPSLRSRPFIVLKDASEGTLCSQCLTASETAETQDTAPFGKGIKMGKTLVGNSEGSVW